VSFRVDGEGSFRGVPTTTTSARHTTTRAEATEETSIPSASTHDDQHDQRDRDAGDDLARDDDEDRDGAKDFHHRARGAIGGARERDARADR